MKVSISALLLLTANFAFAECPSALDHETMSECIMIEGSGVNYQEWKTHFHQSNNENHEKSNKGMISNITGKDVRDLQPAAGNTRNQ